MQQSWIDHALAHPDKAGRTTPEQLARRRANLVRAFVLLGRNYTRAVEYLDKQGDRISRQALARQLDTAATIADVERLVFRSLSARSTAKAVGDENAEESHASARRKGVQPPPA